MNRKILTIVAFLLVLPLTFLILKFIPSNTPQASSFLNIADFSDDRVLVGIADNVFVAKVIDHIGDRNDRGVPESQFSAEIVINLKGDLSGKVVVNQFPQDDVIVMESDTTYRHPAPLQSGHTYIFSTLRHPNGSWNSTITDPNAYILISEDASLNLEQLKEVLQTNKRYIELTEAFKNQISWEEYRASYNKQEVDTTSSR